MQIRKLDVSTFLPVAGALQDPQSIALGGSAPCSGQWGMIEGAAATDLEPHHGGKALVLVEGAGVITQGAESATLAVGDVVFLQPLAESRLSNASLDHRLLFLTLSWEDVGGLLAAADGAAADGAAADGAAAARAQRTVLVLPQPIDEGHEAPAGSRTYSRWAADILLRHRRMLGESGSVFDAALGEDSTDAHQAACDALVQALHGQGHLLMQEVTSWVCRTCDGAPHFSNGKRGSRLLGVCPHCESPSQGESCRSCGMPHAEQSLIDAKCGQCGSAAEEEEAKRLVFPLEPHRALVESLRRKTTLPAMQLAALRQLLAAPLPVVVASYVDSDGTPVALDACDGQYLAPWLEGLATELNGLDSLAAKASLDGGWRALLDSDVADVVRFLDIPADWELGVLRPVVMAVLAPAVGLPKVIHAAAEDIEDPTIATAMQEHWKGWLQSVERRIETQCEGRIPQPGKWTAHHLVFLQRLKSCLEEAEDCLAPSRLSPQGVSHAAQRVVRLGLAFGKSEGVGRLPGGCLPGDRLQVATDEGRTAIALEAAALRTLAMVTQPLMPEFSEQLWTDLGYATPLEGWESEPHFVPSGQRVSQPGPQED